MRVVIKLTSAFVREHCVPDLDQLRSILENRLSAALQAWELEKQRLQEAVARAETKEHEYNEIAENVKQRLAAIDLVALMHQEQQTPALPAPAPQALAPVALPQPGPPPTIAPEPIIRSSSRPLFPDRRGRVLCILP